MMWFREGEKVREKQTWNTRFATQMTSLVLVVHVFPQIFVAIKRLFAVLTAVDGRAAWKMMQNERDDKRTWDGLEWAAVPVYHQW